MKSLLIVLVFSGCVYAQFDSYEMVSDSKMDSLLSDADAIVLDDSRVITVDNSEIEYVVKKKIQINNRGKLNRCKVNLYESEFYKLSDFDAVLKDTLGNEIKELDSDDIEEMTLSSGYIYKIKSFKLLHDVFPFVLEYTYTYDFESHFFWPNWKPQTNIPVMSASYKLVLEDDVKYKTHTIGMDFEPIFFNEDGDKVHLFSAKNIAPRKNEKYLPAGNKTQNAVLFAPETFELGESKGSFSSWDEVAKWYWSISKDRYQLTPEVILEIKELVKDLSDPYQKIELLYKYLQNKTRYVQIYLDIGGWQPHPASWAYENRFGDCKDLATLMITMLKSVGIKSYPALVLTKNRGHVYEEFPSNQFNHEITFVPLEKDTLWLDCTWDYISYKDTPYWVEGTSALIVKENGSEILKVHQRAASKNLQYSSINGKIDSRGKFSVEGNIQTSGSIKNHYKINIEKLKQDELKRLLIKELSEHQSNFKLNNFFYTQQNDSGSLLLDFSGEYKGFSKEIGKRLFLNPNFLNRETQKYVPDDEDRIYPFELVKYPYLYIDTLQIALPDNYIIESAPEMIDMVYPFGKYKTSYKIEKGIFYYKRLFEYSVDLIYPDQYQKFREFYKTVVDTDKTKFVLKAM